MNFKTSETIAAISTAISESGIGIVRISGKDAVCIVEKIFKSARHKNLKDQRSHTIHYGYIVEGKEYIDEVLIMLMKGPHSFTGEDVVEINCHGGVYVVKRIYEMLLKYGARPADPGEFTKRAFLNGRIDLSQAEAVADVIQSTNEYALKNSVNHLKGSMKIAIDDMRKKILHHIAFIETALDDPEHISIDGYEITLEKDIYGMTEEIIVLIQTFENGRIIKEGIKTVIIGKPNAGKSSLLNALLGEDRAIVTHIPGTTRDVLEETICLHGITLKIADTAGIRDTDDIVERIGVEKAKEYTKDADLIIYVIDASTPLDENDKAILELIQEKKVIILLNKSDLEMVVREEEIKEIINEGKLAKNNGIEYQILHISAKNKENIKNIQKIIENMFYKGKINLNNHIYITNSRHKNELELANESLKKVLESIASGMPEDFYSIDLMDAYEALGNITGETIGEDLVNEIFSKFCMGK